MLFDTSVVIEMLKKRRQYEYGSISTITLVEIVRGVADSEMAETVTLMKQMFQIYGLDDEVVLAYSRFYQGLKSKKKDIQDADLIIAATAYAKGETLITRDSDFKVLKEMMDIKIE